MATINEATSDDSSLVLVTGGNGYVGSAIIVKLLQAGFKVRAAVRRQDAVDQVKSITALESYSSSGALSFSIVPDITKADAFLEPAQGCSYIIHSAGPLPLKDLGDLVPATLGGTQAILKAADATPSIKRVIFTASIYSILTWDQILPTDPDSQALLAGNPEHVPLLSANNHVPNYPTCTNEDAPLKRYAAGKVAAKNDVTKHFKHASHHYSAINICAGYCVGPSLVSRTKMELFTMTTNSLIAFPLMHYPLGSFYGYPPNEEAPLPAYVCHIDNCAEAHVKALTSSKYEEGEHSFLLLSDGPSGPKWNDAAGIIKKDLPDIAKLLPFAGSVETIPGKFDCSDVERELLGRPLKPYSKMVVDAYRQWYELPQQ